MTNSVSVCRVLPIHPWLSAYLLFAICYLSIQRMRDVDESLPVGKWAFGLMLAFLICLLGISWAVAVDWQSRHELERISQPTAVGDPIAKEILLETVAVLAVWLGNIVDLLEPDVMILGGGVATMLSPFFDEIRRRLPAWCVNSRCLEIPLVPARYGENAGIAGGAALCTSGA